MAKQQKFSGKKSKQTFVSKPVENKPEVIPSQTLPDKQIVRKVSVIPNVKPLNFNEIAFGTNQKEPKAPLSVPLGFTTEIPFDSAINATILANPCPIPVRNLYSIMLSDPVAYSSMLYLVTSVMARIGDYNNPDYPEIQTYVRDVIKRIGKRKLLQGLLTSLWAGFATIRLHWGVVDDVTTITSIQVLPQDSILLAATPEGELDPDFGVMQYYYNINSAWMQQPSAYAGYGQNAPLSGYGARMTPYRQLTYNMMYITALPLDHVIHLPFNPTGLSGNKYGVSMIQSIYSSITGKANQWAKIAIASSYKAAPMVMFVTDTQTTVQTAAGPISIAENLENTLTDSAASGYMIVEGKDAIEHHVIDNTADMDKMIAPIYLYNDEIRAGLITPNLVGNSGSYANAMANTDANSEMINNITLHIIDALETQLVKRLIDVGVDDVDKPDHYGYFELLDNSLDDATLWGKVMEMGKNLGVIDPKSLDDVNFIRKHLKMPPLSELSEDIIFNMSMAMNDGLLRGTNIGKTKQDIKTPYANGGVKEIKKDQYAS